MSQVCRTIIHGLVLVAMVLICLMTAGCPFPEIYYPRLEIISVEQKTGTLDCLVDSSVISEQILNPEPSGLPRVKSSIYYRIRFPIKNDGTIETRKPAIQQIDDSEREKFLHSPTKADSPLNPPSTSAEDGALVIYASWRHQRVFVTVVHGDREYTLTRINIEDYFRRDWSRYKPVDQSP